MSSKETGHWTGRGFGWAEWELEILHELMPKVGREGVQVVLEHRTLGAISRMACHLGVTYRNARGRTIVREEQRIDQCPEPETHLFWQAIDRTITGSAPSVLGPVL